MGLGLVVWSLERQLLRHRRRPPSRCATTGATQRSTRTSPGSGRPTKTPKIPPVASGSRALDAPSATKVRRRPSTPQWCTLHPPKQPPRHPPGRGVPPCGETHRSSSTTRCSTSEHAIHRFLSARPPHTWSTQTHTHTDLLQLALPGRCSLIVGRTCTGCVPQLILPSFRSQVSPRRRVLL